MTHAESVDVAAGTAKSLNRRIRSNFVWSIMSVAVGKGAFVLANIYLARVLGVESFGVFMLAQTVALYFWLAVDLGTNMYGIREIAKDKENAQNIINPLMGLRITAGVVIFAVYIAGLYLVDFGITDKLAFVGCGLYLITFSIYSDWVFKGIEKFRYIAYGSLVSSVIFFAGLLVAVKGSGDLALASFLWSGSFLLASVSMLYALGKAGLSFRPEFTPRVWYGHIRESIYFTISGSLLVLYHYFPMLMLKYYFTDYEVGIFSAPFRVGLAIGSAGFLIPSSFYPVLSELYHKDIAGFRKTRARLQIIMLALGLPVGIIGYVFAGEAVRLIWGAKYADSVQVLRITCWLIPLYFIRYSYGSVLFATGFQRWQNLGGAAGVVGILLAGFVLVPAAGVVGAASSLVFAESLIVVTMMAVSSYALSEKRLDARARSVQAG